MWEKLNRIDKRIGRRIKQVRKSCGLSQIELADRVGISFQQIQKYEKGATKISVFRLHQISEALGIPITDFFKEGESFFKVSGPKVEYASAETPLEHSLLNKEEVILLKLFRKIRNVKLRDGILRQIRGVIELERKE